MFETGNKSLSDSNLTEQMDQPRTPPNFVARRNKRVREHGYDNEDFNSFKDEIKVMISAMLATQQEQLSKVYPTLMDIKTTNINIENAMAALSAQNEDLKKKIEFLETRSKRDNDYIIILEDKIEDLQRAARKSNFEIKNVPKALQETRDDLVKMVLTLSKSVESTIDKKDITDVFRVQNKRHNTKSSTIVVELGSTLLKADFIRKIKDFNKANKEKICAKHLGLKTGEYNPIFVSEQLTAKGARLFFLARDLAKSRNYKFCWTSFGKVLVKKDDNASTITITNEAQVNSLMQQI